MTGEAPASSTAATAELHTALKRIDRLEGWLTDEQATCLWRAASRVPSAGRIVEIGSFRGRSTIVLASAAAAGVEIVAIDPHAGSDRGPQQIAPDAQLGERDFAAFHANLRAAGVHDRVRHVRAGSLDALDLVAGAVDLLYVDGAHRYRPARADIERWGARVSSGGTMLMHDAFNAIGVTLAQMRLLVLSSQWRYRGRCGSLAEYQRTPLGAAARARNATRQLLGLAYFARNLTVKLLIVARLRPLTRLLGQRDGTWPY